MHWIPNDWKRKKLQKVPLVSPCYIEVKYRTNTELPQRTSKEILRRLDEDSMEIRLLADHSAVFDVIRKIEFNLIKTKLK